MNKAIQRFYKEYLKHNWIWPRIQKISNNKLTIKFLRRDKAFFGLTDQIEIRNIWKTKKLKRKLKR